MGGTLEQYVITYLYDWTKDPLDPESEVLAVVAISAESYEEAVKWGNAHLEVVIEESGLVLDHDCRDPTVEVTSLKKWVEHHADNANRLARRLKEMEHSGEDEPDLGNNHRNDDDYDVIMDPDIDSDYIGNFGPQEDD